MERFHSDHLNRTIYNSHPEQDSNLGLRVSVYLNLIHALNCSATTAGLQHILKVLNFFCRMTTPDFFDVLWCVTWTCQPSLFSGQSLPKSWQDFQLMNLLLILASWFRAKISVWQMLMPCKLNNLKLWFYLT